MRSLLNVPVDNLLETNLSVFEGRVVSLEDIQREFTGTNHHEELASKDVRFSGYAWDDRDKFRERFGPDVDPVQHGIYQARTVAIPALLKQREREDEAQRILPEDEELTVAYCVTHDYHEGTNATRKKMDRDDLLTEKTKKSEAVERVVWEEMMRDVYSELPIEDLVRFGLHVEDSDDLLGNFWSVSIERVGYLETGQTAWVVAEQDELTKPERSSSRDMALSVIGNSLATIERHRAVSTHADDFLIALEPTLQQIQRVFGITRAELLASEYVIK